MAKFEVGDIRTCKSCGVIYHMDHHRRAICSKCRLEEKRQSARDTYRWYGTHNSIAAGKKWAKMK